MSLFVVRYGYRFDRHFLQQCTVACSISFRSSYRWYGLVVRSPSIGRFNAEVFLCLVSIRAYGAQQFFREESLRRINHYLRIARTSYNLNRWVGIRIDLLGASFTTALAAYLLIRKTLNAANIGFSLNMSLEFCAMILYVVRCYNDFEVQSNRYAPFILIMIA